MAFLHDRPDRFRVRPRSARELILAAGEVILATALATACIAALQDTAPAEGLGVLYLLAVLAVAIRRGQLEALATAVLSMLTLNYLFITPRHELTIAHSQDVVELGVLLIVAVVVGRLAATGRERAAEAERRAVLGARREREATLLARGRLRDPRRDERRRAAGHPRRASRPRDSARAARGSRWSRCHRRGRRRSPRRCARGREPPGCTSPVTPAGSSTTSSESPSRSVG